MEGPLRVVLEGCTICLMLLSFAGYLSYWISRPTDAFWPFYSKLQKHTTNKYFGSGGIPFLFNTVPVVSIAILGAIYLEIRRRRSTRNRSRGKVWRFNLWTYMVLTKGPLGVVSGADAIFLLLFTALVLWMFSEYISTGFEGIDANALPKNVALWQKKMEVAGKNVGHVSFVCLGFLFLPIPRSSVFLQLFNIPFEHGVRYHIWIANIMMLVMTVHGLLLYIYWGTTHTMRAQGWTWKDYSTTGITGTITWLVGMVLWLTSLHPIRRRKFEFFYYTHYLYIAFIAGYVMHQGEHGFAVVLGGLLLYCVDRFLRFVQSQKRVEVLSARMLTNEMMEIKISKRQSLQYDPASIIFINVPAISYLQWHPFTIASSSTVDDNHILILPKCCGEWTNKLRDIIIELNTTKENHSFKIAVEGPYGQNLDYMGKYDSLIFIGGGSGISPFIGILRTLLHQENDTNTNEPPTHVLLIWSVKKHEDIKVLDVITSSLSHVNGHVNIDIEIYITQETEKDVEMHPLASRMVETTNAIHLTPMFSLGTKGGILQAIVVLFSIGGFLVFHVIINKYYIYPIDHNTDKKFSKWGKGLLSVFEMFLGIVSFGGIVIFIWLWNAVQAKEPTSNKELVSNQMDTLPISKLHYGSRPSFSDIFSIYASEAIKSNKPNIGVFVCGPESMQESVAYNCRGYSNTSFTFHYHSLNFNL